MENQEGDSSLNTVNFPSENTTCNVNAPAKVVVENTAPLMSSVSLSPDSSAESTSSEASTDATVTRVSNTEIPLFRPEEMTTTVVSILCHFFNISKPSDDDIIFLL